MKKYPLYIFWGLVMLMLVQLSCRDLENITAPKDFSIIKSVIPAQGPYGARIMIGGTGFGSEKANLELYFNKAEAFVEELNDSTILTRVPREATTGPVEVVVNGETLTGPTFTVDTSENLWLDITEVNPSEGGIGEPVEIKGSGFNPDAQGNKIYFGETLAEVHSASDSLLNTAVPADAQSGPVMVVVDQDTVVGPTFTVKEPKSLMVTVLTEGTEPDEDGYEISVTGKDNQSVLTNDEVFYEEIYDDVVEVTLSGIASNCRVEGEKPRKVSLDVQDITSTTFNVDCTVDLRDYIVYTSHLHGNAEIHFKNEDGSFITIDGLTTNKDGSIRVTETSDTYEIYPVISPNGLQIAYTANGNIFVMDSDGSDIRQLTNDDTKLFRNPSWSPTGDTLVFEGGVEIMDLYTIEINGTNLQNITNTAKTDYTTERNPDWSPKGTHILFERYVDGNQEIFTIEPDGTNESQITNNSVYDRDAEWSPDGTKIAFIREVPDVGGVVHIMNADGSSAEELVPTRGTVSNSPSWPTWSPDGTKIAYTINSDGVMQIRIYSIEVDDNIYTPWTQGDDYYPNWNYE